MGQIGREDIVSALRGCEGREYRQVSPCPQFSGCAVGTVASDGILLARRPGRIRRRGREMFRGLDIVDDISLNPDMNDMQCFPCIDLLDLFVAAHHK